MTQAQFLSESTAGFCLGVLFFLPSTGQGGRVEESEHSHFTGAAMSLLLSLASLARLFKIV